VDRDGFGDGEFFHRFGEDAFAFLLGENGMVGIVELGDVAAFVVVADEAFEDDEGSAGGVLHVGAEAGEIERSFLDGEHGKLTSGEGGHEGDGLVIGEKVGPVGEFVVESGFDVGEVEGEVVLEAELFPE
jgi:hypothetical protein